MFVQYWEEAGQRFGDERSCPLRRTWKPCIRLFKPYSVGGVTTCGNSRSSAKLMGIQIRRINPGVGNSWRDWLWLGLVDAKRRKAVSLNLWFWWWLEAWHYSRSGARSRRSRQPFEFGRRLQMLLSWRGRWSLWLFWICWSNTGFIAWIAWGSDWVAGRLVRPGRIRWGIYTRTPWEDSH